MKVRPPLLSESMVPAIHDRRKLAAQFRKRIDPHAALQAHYTKTALARMGIPFERAMQIDAIRIAVEGAYKRQQRKEAALSGENP